MLKRTIRKMFNRFELDIVRQSLHAPEKRYDRQSEADALIKTISLHTMVSYEDLVTLFQQAVWCEERGIMGDFVECGVWKGGCVGLMALVNLRYGKQRRHIHLFDAFQEICEPDEAVDGERAVREARMWVKDAGSVAERRYTGELKPLTGIYDHRGGPGTLEENRRLLEEIIAYDRQFLHYHKGWFQDTVPSDADGIGEIAILRLDGDWYASTKVCLDFLFEKVVKGGFVIIDDYGAYEGCKRAVDEHFETKKLHLFLHHVNKDIRYLVKPA